MNLGDITHHLSGIDRARGFQRGIALPESTQLLLLPAFALGRDSAVALVSLALLASLTLLMLCYGRRVGHPIVGAAGAILIYACPIAAKYYPLPNIDVGTAASLFALFYFLQLWDQQPPVQLAIAIGILAGFSSAANPQAVVAFPYAIGLSAWKLWRQRKPGFPPVFTASALALAFAAPWFFQDGASVALNRGESLWLLAVVGPLAVVALRLPPGPELLLAATAFPLPHF